MYCCCHCVIRTLAWLHDMEEWVGKHWHHYISARAMRSFDYAEVTLESMQKRLSVLFRALSGQQAADVRQATLEQSFSRRGLLQRIAGSGRSGFSAWCDEDGLCLPPRLAVFPDKTLNESLYLWLAVLATSERRPGKSALADAAKQAALTLQCYPQLRARYNELAEAYVELRRDLPVKGGAEIQVERAICEAILAPERGIDYLPATIHSPHPVAIWLQSPRWQNPSAHTCDASEEQGKQQSGHDESVTAKERHQGERTEMPDTKSGLLSFRLESLFSWTEYLPVDRPGDDNDDDNAEQSANDMDVITVARDREAGQQKIKLDLDLPSEAYDDIRLGEGVHLPEWDYRRQRMQQDHSLLLELQPRNAEPCELPARLKSSAQRLRRQFETLLPHRHWQKRCLDGDELDLNTYIDFHVGNREQRQEYAPVYQQLRNDHRDLSCLLLADFSASTDAWVNSEARVVEVVQDAMLLFGEALGATRDRFAMYGFASRNRSHNRFYQLKRFDQPFDAQVRGNIMAVEPCYYTRMGAAIRYASQLLQREQTSQRLLLLLTDGKPNDLDKYESRYGVEDTRQAVLEARQLGLIPFCVTIDDKAEDYLPYLFGQKQWLHVQRIEDLPKKLLQLYMLLTQ